MFRKKEKSIPVWEDERTKDLIIKSNSLFEISQYIFMYFNHMTPKVIRYLQNISYNTKYDKFIRAGINTEPTYKKGIIDELEKTNYLSSLPVYLKGTTIHCHKMIVKSVFSMDKKFMYGLKLHCIPSKEELREIMIVEKSVLNKTEKIRDPVMNILVGPNNYSAVSFLKIYLDSNYINKFLDNFEREVQPEIYRLISRKSSTDLLNLTPDEIIEIQKIYMDNNIFLRIFDYKTGILLPEDIEDLNVKTEIPSRPHRPDMTDDTNQIIDN